MKARNWEFYLDSCLLVMMVHRELAMKMETPFVKADVWLPRPNSEQGKVIRFQRSHDSSYISICSPHQPLWPSSFSKTSPSKTLQGQVSSLWMLFHVILQIFVGRDCGKLSGLNTLYTLARGKFRSHPQHRNVCI